jgi:deazaflavin-dependent oxidoreductase (nitroreductase family)
MADYEWFMKAHRFVYHHSHGWIGGNLGGIKMVLMYTIGAKTGLVRVVPLQYYPIDPTGILVLASNNGQPRSPAWYHNLKAHADIDILVGRRKRRVHAEELTADERTAVWPQMRKQNKAIDDYARKAGRTLPILRLRTLMAGPSVSSGDAGRLEDEQLAV